MRKDMSKVIVERPRRGGKGRKGRKNPSKETILLEADADFDGPIGRVREGMKRVHRESWNEKELNENLRPLERYLRSQVGRPWNKVFSEICENISLDNAVQAHIRQHVTDFIELQVEFRDGVVYRINRSYGGGRYGLHKEAMYVHPESGLLSLVK